MTKKTQKMLSPKRIEGILLFDIKGAAGSTGRPPRHFFFVSAAAASRLSRALSRTEQKSGPHIVQYSVP